MYYNQDRMRFELLRALYVHARQQPHEPFSEAAIAEEFAVSPMQFDRVVEWLEQHGFVRAEGPDGTLSITPKGLDELDERATAWQREVEAIWQWLAGEKERIGRACARGAGEGISREEIALKKDAIAEARRRRQALEARMRDLRTPIEP